MFGARRGAHRQSNEIRVRVEEMRATRDGRTILRVAKITEERFFCDADADAEHALVVVRALHREEPQERASESELHRSHATRSPPPKPAANQARLGPRPTSRSVPAAPAARAAAIAATASSVAPRVVNAPANNGRASQARKSPVAVTMAARAASRSSPPTCTRTSALGSPDSSAAAAACTILEFTRRSRLIVRPPISPVTSPTSAPRPRPRTPADACAVATAATVAGPYSG